MKLNVGVCNPSNYFALTFVKSTNNYLSYYFQFIISYWIQYLNIQYANIQYVISNRNSNQHLFLLLFIFTFNLRSILSFLHQCLPSLLCGVSKKHTAATIFKWFVHIAAKHTSIFSYEPQNKFFLESRQTVSIFP